MNVPSNRIKVASDVPSAHDDEWAFTFVVFYAHDKQVIPPRDWNGRNRNEWFMFIHETHCYTNETRVIHIAPEYTTDGRVKGVDLSLRLASDPEVPKHTVQHYKVEEWPLKWNKVKAYGTFFHRDLIKSIRNADWKEAYLHGIPPFDSNHFCINFAHFFESMGLIDESDIRYLINLTRTSWPRSDGSNLPYRI